MVKEIRTKYLNVYAGWDISMFGLGIYFDRYHFDITIGFVWVSIEW